MAHLLVGPQTPRTSDETAIALLELAPEYVGLEAGPVSDAQLHELRGTLEAIRQRTLRRRRPGLQKCTRSAAYAAATHAATALVAVISAAG